MNSHEIEQNVKRIIEHLSNLDWASIGVEFQYIYQFTKQDYWQRYCLQVI